MDVREIPRILIKELGGKVEPGENFCKLQLKNGSILVLKDIGPTIDNPEKKVILQYWYSEDQRRTNYCAPWSIEARPSITGAWSAAKGRHMRDELKIVFCDYSFALRPGDNNLPPGIEIANRCMRRAVQLINSPAIETSAFWEKERQDPA